MTANTITLAGLSGRVTIRRDAYGVAHVAAENEMDAWFGQGFVSAQDRLWQMEYDRRRAVGRWAEAAGPSAVAADKLARQMDLGSSSRGDVGLMDPGTRAMFDAFAAGVNAYIFSGQPLPPEYALTGITPEPWEPWHSVVLFKVRHVTMGLWYWKLAVGSLRARVDDATWASLRFLPSIGTPVIVPPAGQISALFDHAGEELMAAAKHLDFLKDIDGGSNSWVVSGSRTTTGKPVICNDSHRALDVPNAYWQVHISFPGTNISGATFAGFPGFPHFGFNGSIAWNITHTQADYQDLYVEKFEGENAEQYLTTEGWKPSTRVEETIHVRGGDPVTFTRWATHHGPVVNGDPRSGYALAFKYSASEKPKPAFNGIRESHAATTIEALFDAQRDWVDPVNNLVAADTAGNIGYLMRGELPVRTGRAGRIMPVPGWTGEYEWTGVVPPAQWPRAINPAEGFFATANNRVIEADEPYIGTYFAASARVSRLVELMNGTGTLDPATIASWQGDTTSVPARAWTRKLAECGPFSGDAEAARAMLANWDANLLPGSAAAVLYAYFRREVMRDLFLPVLGEETFAWLTSDANVAIVRIYSGLMNELTSHMANGIGTPSGASWNETVEPALARAWSVAKTAQGDVPAAWRWDRDHRTGSRHPLSRAFPGESLDPPSAHIGGDADTLQCTAYGISGRNDFVLTNLSVYRQVVDFADIDAASYIIPGGISGDPRSEHYADQLPLWQTHQRIPMYWSPAAAEANAPVTCVLQP